MSVSTFDTFDSAAHCSIPPNDFSALAVGSFGACIALIACGTDVLRISIRDSTGQRRLVIEGTLSAPWVEELRPAWIRANADLKNRKLIVDLRNVTAISRDGETALLKMMSEGAKFRSRGVLTKHVLRELSRLNRRATTTATGAATNAGEKEPKKT